MRVVSNQSEGGHIGGGAGRGGYFLNGAPEETDLPEELARQLIADGVATLAEGEEVPAAAAPDVATGAGVIHVGVAPVAPATVPAEESE